MAFEPASDVLSHIKVLDLTRVRAGPTCVRQLADWGADVIKIEEANTDSASGMGGPRDGPDFQNLHRNKRAMVLNLKHSEGLKVFLDLVKTADVIVENYRPAVKYRLGIDYDTVAKINPRIVYGSISGFGQTGPYRDRPGFDQIAQGLGGLMSITGAPGGGPMRVGIPIADLSAGIFCAQGILLALIARERTGTGQWVQSSLLQAQIFMLDFQAARWLQAAEIPLQAGNDHPTSMPTGVFQTADGYVNIACSGQAMWARLKEILRDPELEWDGFSELSGRSRNRAALHDIISSHTCKQTAGFWIRELNKAGVPCGPINTIDKVFDDPQVQHLSMAIDVDDKQTATAKLVAQPIHFNKASSAIRRPAPALDEHTDEILTESGYLPSRIKALREIGVIGVRSPLCGMQENE